ncbi:hypothetical protein NPIL_465551, partial [Nephila pilipes]
EMAFHFLVDAAVVIGGFRLTMNDGVGPSNPSLGPDKDCPMLGTFNS